MRLKLLSPFDREVKNISSFKDPFNFWQVPEAYYVAFLQKQLAAKSR